MHTPMAATHNSGGDTFDAFCWWDARHKFLNIGQKNLVTSERKSWVGAFPHVNVKTEFTAESGVLKLGFSKLTSPWLAKFADFIFQ